MKKSNVLRKINTYYSRNSIANDLLKIAVDEDRLQQQLDKSDDPNEDFDLDEYKSSIYEKYNIHQFNTKKEFMEYYTSKSKIDEDKIEDAILRTYEDDLNNGKISYNDIDKMVQNAIKEENLLLSKQKEELEKAYENYSHRDELIESGQYEDYRTQIFKDNYVKMLNEVGLTNDAINFSRLSLEQVRTLLNRAPSNKYDDRASILPHLGGFDYHIYGVKDSKFVQENIAKEMQDAIDDYNEAQNDPKNKISWKNIRENLGIIVNKRLTRNLKVIVSLTTTNEDYYKSLLKQEKQGKKIIKETPHNTLLLFIGSTKGKNADFVKGYLEYRKKYL